MLNKKCPFSWVTNDSPYSPAPEPIQGKCTENDCMAWITCDDDRAPGYCQIIEKVV